MANFVDCWNSLKAKGYKHADGTEVLNEQDRASIEKRIQEHLKTGLDPIEAAKASVKAHLDEAHAQLQSIYDQVKPAAETPATTVGAIPQGQATVPVFAQRFNPETLFVPPRWAFDKYGKAFEDKIFGLIHDKNPMAVADITPIWKVMTPAERQELLSRGFSVTNTRTAGQVALLKSRDAVSAQSYYRMQEKRATQPVSEAGQAPAVAGQPKTEGGIGEEKVQVQGQEKGRVLAETPAAAVPPETPEQLGQALSEKPRLAGPSNRVLQERALRGEIPQAPESGIGVLKEDLVRRANEQYTPERAQIAGDKVMQGKGTTLDEEALIVLQDEKLTKIAADAERAMKANPTDLALQQAYQTARNAMTDWQHGPLKTIGTIWGSKGINLQGATDVDTGTLVGLQKLAWATGKGDIPVEQHPIFDEAANRVRIAEAEEKASITKANDAVQKVLKPSRYMDLNQLRESLATTLKSMTC